MNAYFIYVIVRVQMGYVYTQVLDGQTQKYFWVFYMFWKAFLYSIGCVLRVFPKSQICFVEKLLYKYFLKCFASKVSYSQVAKMWRWIFNSSKILHRESHDSFVSHSRDMATREICLMQMRIFASNPRVLRKSLSHEMTKIQFL